MPNAEQKLRQRSVLTKAIYDVLYIHSYSKVIVFGLSCVFASYSYAEAMRIGSPDTKMVDAAIAKIEQKQQNEIDKQLLQQQQQQDTLDHAVQQFDAEAVYQLNEMDIPQVDTAMVDEIYQLAEQAQQEARQQETLVPPIQQLIEEQKIGNVEILTNTENPQAARVDELMGTLQQEHIENPIFQAENTDENRVQIDQNTVPKKRGFFSRLFKRNAPLEEQVTKLPKIKVTVQGGNVEVANNIKAKLSNFTVEAFEDFNTALPQLKILTTQAAQAMGYYQAEFQFTKQDDDRLIILMIANEPVLVKSQQIEFSGEGAERPTFQVIKVVPDLNEDDVLNHASYETTKNRINTAASDQGFFDGYWKMHDVKVTLPENTADIILKYETGERYKLHDVEFQMSDPSQSFPLRRSVLEQLVPFKDGDDYTSWRINLLSNNLINSRYFSYVLVNVLKPDPLDVPLELPPDIQLLLQQQEQQKQQLAVSTASVNAEEITTQNIVDENVFAGAEPTKAQTALVKLKEKPETSQDSNDAEQQAATDKKAPMVVKQLNVATAMMKEIARVDKKVPVIVTLNADNPNNLETGIGYGTDTGVRLRTQYRRAIVNDRGHSFDANLELSTKRQSLDGRYMIPYKHPLNDYFSLVGGYEREVRDGIGQGVELDIDSLVLGVERLIKRPLGQWQHNMSVRYRLDRIDSNGVIDERDLPDAFKVISSEPEQASLLFGYEISRTEQNNRINPTKGFRQFYRAEVGTESLLTETDLAILNAGWRFIYSLGENADHQFVGRGDLGYIFTDNFDRVPYNLRYFAGGDQSIRGYDYKSLAPKEDQLLLGGQALAVASLEYNYQFKAGWRAAIFADAGNAFDEKFGNETKYGVGVGVRWASPVGPIRIDVGAGVSEDSIPIRLHFFIGPAL